MRSAASLAVAGVLALAILGTVGTLAVQPAPQALPPRCVAIVAKAVTTQSHIVPGSFDCLDGQMQDSAAFEGYGGDQGLEQFAIDRGLTTEHPMQQLAEKVGTAWMYDVSGPSTHQIVFFFADFGLIYRFDGESL